MYWFYVGQWDLFAFVAGAFLAEGHVVLELVEADGELELPVEQHKSWNRIAKTFLQKSKSMECFRQLQIAACFISGIYLLCMCHVTVEETSPEYKFLLSIQSPGWDHPEMFSRCWRSVGAILTIYAISQSTVLQKPFDSRLVQFLGRISFPLYLVHPTVYLVIKQPVRNILWYIITQSSYPGTIEASQDGLAFGVAWAGALMTSLVLMVFISDLWERFIDMNCLALARKFEKWVTK
ncbi:acyltransferase 3 [Penicillium atrosanguineum]|nr:acyltransferase 3 [Penicillium atrosanguineum]